MPDAATPALAPKLPHACSCCDELVREVARTDAQGRPLRWRRREGTRLAVLVHLDGAISEHTLCCGCEISAEHLPQIWRRQCLLYFESCSGRHILDGHAERFAANVPIGILEIRAA